MTSRPLDAARDALIAVQGQLIALLAARNAALEERVGELEERLACGVPEVCLACELQ